MNGSRRKAFRRMRARMKRELRQHVAHVAQSTVSVPANVTRQTGIYRMARNPDHDMRVKLRLHAIEHGREFRPTIAERTILARDAMVAVTPTVSETPRGLLTGHARQYAAEQNRKPKAKRTHDTVAPAPVSHVVDTVREDATRHAKVRQRLQALKDFGM